MIAEVRISRRAIIGSSLAGNVAGGLLSAGFLQATAIPLPVVEVVGREESQIILIDSRIERVLIVAGPFQDQLADAVPRLMGAMRTRIDLLLATETALADGAVDFLDRWHIPVALSLPEVPANGFSRAKAAIDRPLNLTLSHGIQLRCWPHTRFAQSLLGTDPGWRVEIRRGNQSIAIAKLLDDLAAVPCGPFTIAIAPFGSVQLAARKSVAAIYALNDRSLEPVQQDAATTRIFESDAARFELFEDRIRVPAWTNNPSADS